MHNECNVVELTALPLSYFSCSKKTLPDRHMALFLLLHLWKWKGTSFDAQGTKTVG